MIDFCVFYLHLERKRQIKAIKFAANIPFFIKFAPFLFIYLYIWQRKKVSANFLIT